MANKRIQKKIDKKAYEHLYEEGCSCGFAKGLTAFARSRRLNNPDIEEIGASPLLWPRCKRNPIKRAFDAVYESISNWVQMDLRMPMNTWSTGRPSWSVGASSGQKD